MVVPEKIGKIKILQVYDSTNLNNYVSKTGWKNAPEIHYTKYNIKESDMRVKTASFTSPEFIDLTTGQYRVLIYSKYHENFGGYILDVEYDKSTGLYTYQCQDWSRNYISKVEMGRGGRQNLYNILVSILTHFEIDKAYKKTPEAYSSKNKAYFKNVLSGLKPLWRYDQSIYEGNGYKGNPFKNKPKVIMRDKSLIEIIRSLVFSQLGYFDIWFNDRGILQIEPLSKKDWETTGLHVTTGAAMNTKYKFSTTNAITRVLVNNSQGKAFNLNNIQGTLDLSMFFGRVATSIANPVTSNKKTSSSNKNTTSKVTVNSDNPYGTKNKEVWLTIDNINGPTSDMNIMNNIAKALANYGWKTHVFGSPGPSTHYAHAPGYSWSGQVKNGIWFTLYGGACAGTLNEAATATWFRKPLVDLGSRSVVGFLPPCSDIRKGGKYGDFLPRAHDDDFSPSSFTGISKPAEFLTNKGIPFMYASNAKEMAEKFIGGGDNPEACNKNWKWY